MKRFIPALIVLSLTLSACITISTPEPVHITPAFVTATLPPTKTPYASPTSAATKAPTLAVTAPANCKDAAVLLADVTIADGTNVPYGSKFTKTWQFRNTGNCPWSGYSIAFVSGDRMGAPDSAPVPDTAPKTNVNVSVDLVAPSTDGVYTGFFELHNSSGEPLAIGIEKTFWVKITVGTATVTPGTSSGTTGTAPAATGTPQASKGPANCKYKVSFTYPDEITKLINSARAKAGLSELTVNTQLTNSAQAHSIDMACFSLLSHTGSDGSSVQQRIAAAGYPAAYSEEMIFAGGYPQDAFDWWMNDPPHYDVIMDTHVSEIGVGYAYVANSTYGGYFTVDVGSQ